MARKPRLKESAESLRSHKMELTERWSRHHGPRGTLFPQGDVGKNRARPARQMARERITGFLLQQRIAALDATAPASNAAAAVATGVPEGVAGNNATAEPVATVPPLAKPQKAMPHQSAKLRPPAATATAVATNVVAIAATQELTEARAAAAKMDVDAVAEVQELPVAPVAAVATDIDALAEEQELPGAYAAAEATDVDAAEEVHELTASCARSVSADVVAAVAAGYQVPPPVMASLAPPQREPASGVDEAAAVQEVSPSTSRQAPQRERASVTDMEAAAAGEGTPPSAPAPVPTPASAKTQTAAVPEVAPIAAPVPTEEAAAPLKRATANAMSGVEVNLALRLMVMTAAVVAGGTAV